MSAFRKNELIQTLKKRIANGESPVMGFVTVTDLMYAYENDEINPSIANRCFEYVEGFDKNNITQDVIDVALSKGQTAKDVARAQKRIEHKVEMFKDELNRSKSNHFDWCAACPLTIVYVESTDTLHIADGHHRYKALEYMAKHMPRNEFNPDAQSVLLHFISCEHETDIIDLLIKINTNVSKWGPNDIKHAMAFKDSCSAAVELCKRRAYIANRIGVETDGVIDLILYGVDKDNQHRKKGSNFAKEHKYADIMCDLISQVVAVYDEPAIKNRLSECTIPQKKGVKMIEAMYSILLESVIMTESGTYERYNLDNIKFAMQSFIRTATPDTIRSLTKGVERKGVKLNWYNNLGQYIHNDVTAEMFSKMRKRTFLSVTSKCK